MVRHGTFNYFCSLCILHYLIYQLQFLSQLCSWNTDIRFYYRILSKCITQFKPIEPEDEFSATSTDTELNQVSCTMMRNYTTFGYLLSSQYILTSVCFRSVCQIQIPHFTKLSYMYVPKRHLFYFSLSCWKIPIASEHWLVQRRLLLKTPWGGGGRRYADSSLSHSLSCVCKCSVNIHDAPFLPFILQHVNSMPL